MSGKLRLRAAAGTNPGRVHSVDQDNAFVAIRDPEMGKTRGLFIVADGMGGHQAGEIASSLAVETIREELTWFLGQSDAEDTQPSGPSPGEKRENPAALELLGKRLLLAIERANKAITQYAENNPTEAGNLGTTVTCVLVDDDLAVIANIGDSRTYLLRDGVLQQITEDHSYVAHLVREGQIAPQDIYVHPRRNVITRSLGYRPDVEADLWEESLQPGDRLLLCSDGLWEMVQDEQTIAHIIMETERPQEAVQRLIDAANANGGADNIGVAVVHVELEEMPAD